MNRRRYVSVGLMASTAAEAIVPLARNIALARIISPNEFGLAITLSVVIGLVEVLADFGIPVFAARRPRHLSSRLLLPSMHSLALLRSVALGALLVAGAPFVARMLHATEALPAFAALGVIAALRGFENLGGKALMRTHRFQAEATMSAVSQIVLLAVTVFAAFETRSYACIVWGMLAQTFTAVAVSHLVSPRRWRFGWNPTVVGEAVRFGRPLILNGAAVAAGTGDRLLVGAMLGPVPLALYNVAVGSALLPRSVLARYLTMTFVPLFARTIGKGDGRPLADTWIFCLSALAVVSGGLTAIAGAPVLGYVFGPAYTPPAEMMSALGLLVAVRFLQLLPVPAAYAAGDTRLVTATSAMPLVSMLVGWPVLAMSKSPTAFLAVAALVEFIVLLAVTRLALTRLGFRSVPVWILVAAPPLILAVLPLASFIAPALRGALWPVFTLVALTAAGYALIRQRYAIAMRAALS